MIINSVFEIMKPTNPPLLNIAGKMITLLIFILLKLFANPIPFLNLTSLKHFISIKIRIVSLTVTSPSLFYQIVGNLTLNLMSPDSSSFSFFMLRNIFPFLFSYWYFPLDPLLYYWIC